MRDSTDDDIDRAYRMAVEATVDAAEVQRRRRAVLDAVAGRDAIPAARTNADRAALGDRVAANDAHPHLFASWWRGVAAACVIGASALVVVRMQQAPETAVETGRRSETEKVVAAAPAPAPLPANESAAVQVAEAAPRQAQVSTAPAPAPVTDAHRRAPTVRAAAPAEGQSITAPDPVAKAARSALLGDSVDAAARAPGHGLLHALNKGDIDAVRTILQATDPDAERDADGRTALAIATLRANVPLVKLLLASGANRRAVDRFGHTPESYAHASANPALLQAFEKP